MLKDADPAFADLLSSRVPEAGVRAAEPRYLEEPRGKWTGRESFVARPPDTETVAAIVRLCAEHSVGIVPYGGGTGLVGGQISTSGPVPLILSMERMSAIRAVYPDEAALVAEAGATLWDVQEAAAEAGLLFPLSYASQQSARIGGALAVNSGGLNVLRYGMARDLCLGIEAVLPNGEVMLGLRRLRKDNTGYDLRHLLIGAEGTLGVITAASLALSPRPARVATAFLAVEAPAEALAVYARLRDRVGNQVSAFELISGVGLEFLARTHPDTRQPFDHMPRWSILVELGTGADSDAEAILLGVIEDAMAEGAVRDGVVAQSETQRQELWAVRETIPEANRAVGAVASHDISLPLSALPAFIDEAERAVADIADVRINCFGHLGDGNMHFNAFPAEGRHASEYRDEAPAITRAVHDLVAAHEGSFSAEHGLGRLKPDELARYGDPVRLAAMRRIKEALDPAGIMNPGAVFPA